MTVDSRIDKHLKNLDISYDIVEHPPAFTTEEADRYIEGYEGVRTKTMFLTNKKKTAYYLLIMDDQKPLDMELFKEVVNANRIRMASAQSLEEKMKVSPGMVSPFGLLNNEGKDIQVYFDKDILKEPIQTFHPNDNTKTVFIKTQDILTFIESLGYVIHEVTL